MWSISRDTTQTGKAPTSRLNLEWSGRLAPPELRTSHIGTSAHDSRSANIKDRSRTRWNPSLALSSALQYYYSTTITTIIIIIIINSLLPCPGVNNNNTNFPSSHPSQAPSWLPPLVLYAAIQLLRASSYDPPAPAIHPHRHHRHLLVYLS